MHRCFIFLAVILISTVISPSQSTSGAVSAELKTVPVPMPKGLVRARALDVVKDWNPPIVHLRGNAQVRIYTAAKNPRGAIVLQADTVDLNQTTGEITPHGNVRLNIEEIR